MIFQEFGGNSSFVDLIKNQYFYNYKEFLMDQPEQNLPSYIEFNVYIYLLIFVFIFCEVHKEGTQNNNHPQNVGLMNEALTLPHDTHA